MESDTPEHDYFNEWVEAQTPERLERIVSRAQGDVLSEDEIGDQLALAYVEDTFRALEHKGVIEPDGVDADGEIIWGATTSGKSSSMALTGAEASVYTHFNEAEAERDSDATDSFASGIIRLWIKRVRNISHIERATK